MHQIGGMDKRQMKADSGNRRQIEKKGRMKTNGSQLYDHTDTPTRLYSDTGLET